MSEEKVNHPSHYGGASNPYEAIKIIEALGLGRGFCLGNAIKYMVRAGLKEGESAELDLQKASWYADRAAKEAVKQRVKKEIEDAKEEKRLKDVATIEAAEGNL